ncbi:hypothetical protein ES707_20072 [subsurface metagenome]
MKRLPVQLLVVILISTVLVLSGCTPEPITTTATLTTTETTTAPPITTTATLTTTETTTAPPITTTVTETPPIQTTTTTVTTTTTITPTATILCRIAETITPEEAFSLIQDNQGNPDFMIIDVRPPGASPYIEGSISLDYIGGIFSNEVEALDRCGIYLVYCRMGNRSSAALAEMYALNFKEVYEIQGGINAWVAGGLPVV